MTTAQADQARKLFLYNGSTYVEIATMTRASIDDITRYLEGDVSVVEPERKQKPARTPEGDVRTNPRPGGLIGPLGAARATRPDLAGCAGADSPKRKTKYATEEERRQARLDQHKAYRGRLKARRGAVRETLQQHLAERKSDAFDRLIAEVQADQAARSTMETTRTTT